MKLSKNLSISALLVYCLLTVAVSCNNNMIDSSIKQSGENSTARTATQAKIVSGRYGDLSIAMDSKSMLTGVYEFYNDWNNNYKEYMQINVFYFNGICHGDTIEISTAWPTSDQKIAGKLILNSSAPSILKLSLNDLPDGYASVDFTKGDGYIGNLTEKKDWLQVRLIKSPKVKLFDSSDSSKPRKGYLVGNDIVKVIQRTENGWIKIEYNNKNDKKNATYGWIKENELYDLISAKW